MATLTTRQRTILNLIVDDYVMDAAPISSVGLARNHNLGVSSATIRNDIAELEEQGYIYRPHPSAGSVPSDQAYRFYVGALVAFEVDTIRPRLRDSIRRKLDAVEMDVDEWASAAAAVLAGLVGNMAIVAFPKAPESRVRHLELVPMQDLIVMLIVVLERARLKRHLIRLKEPTPPSQLEAYANKASSFVKGLTRREIVAKEVVVSGLEEELIGATVNLLKAEDDSTYREHSVDGLRNLLDQPEFEESSIVRSVVGGVEDGSLAQAVLDEAPHEDAVKVVIGQENREGLLSPLSVVIGQYGIPGEALGAVGAVGPTRMQYSKTIASVKLMASLMSEWIGGVRTR